MCRHFYNEITQQFENYQMVIKATPTIERKNKAICIRLVESVEKKAKIIGIKLGVSISEASAIAIERFKVNEKIPEYKGKKRLISCSLSNNNINKIDEIKMQYNCRFKYDVANAAVEQLYDKCIFQDQS